MSATCTPLWDKQIGQCWYCGNVVGRDSDRILGADGWPTWPPECRPPEIDHQIPRSRGGGGGSNLVLACAPCNHAKGSHTVEEYRAALQRSTPGAVEFFGEYAL